MMLARYADAQFWHTIETIVGAAVDVPKGSPSKNSSKGSKHATQTELKSATSLSTQAAKLPQSTPENMDKAPNQQSPTNSAKSASSPADSSPTAQVNTNASPVDQKAAQNPTPSTTTEPPKPVATPPCSVPPKYEPRSHDQPTLKKLDPRPQVNAPPLSMVLQTSSKLSHHSLY